MPRFFRLAELYYYQNDEPGAEGASGGGTEDAAPTDTSSDDLARIRAALDKERDLRRQYEKEQAKLSKQLALYGDMDPDTARKAKEAWDKQEQFERERAELEASIKGEAQKEYEAQLAQQQQETAKAQQALLDYRRDSELERAFHAAEGFPDEFGLVAHMLQPRVKWSKDGQLVVLNDKGEIAYIAENGQSRPMTPSELIDEMKSKNLGFARHFRGQSRNNLALYGDPNGTAADDSGMSDWDRVNAMRAKRSSYR